MATSFPGWYYSAQMVEEKIRAHFGDYLAHAEVAACLLYAVARKSSVCAKASGWVGLGWGDRRKSVMENTKITKSSTARTE